MWLDEKHNQASVSASVSDLKVLFFWGLDCSTMFLLIPQKARKSPLHTVLTDGCYNLCVAPGCSGSAQFFCPVSMLLICAFVCIVSSYKVSVSALTLVLWLSVLHRFCRYNTYCGTYPEAHFPPVKRTLEGSLFNHLNTPSARALSHNSLVYRLSTLRWFLSCLRALRLVSASVCCVQWKTLSHTQPTLCIHSQIQTWEHFLLSCFRSWSHLLCAIAQYHFSSINTSP